MSEPVELTAYAIDGHQVSIRPAPVGRDWMDATPERFAYRCLPLNIANGLGWEILSPSGFTAEWNGEPGFDCIKVTPDRGTTAMALSHFGSGVLTFHVSCLFRTSPGYDLVAQGPINRPKDGISALTGVIETDWSPFAFTMNWVFTRAHLPVRFEKGEPFCHIFPIERGMLEKMAPRMRVLSDNPELKRDHDAWSQSRSKFMEDLNQPGSEAEAARWQKFYYRGLGPTGEATGPGDHRTRVRLKPFKGREEPD